MKSLLVILCVVSVLFITGCAAPPQESGALPTQESGAASTGQPPVPAGKGASPSDEALSADSGPEEIPDAEEVPGAEAPETETPESAGEESSEGQQECNLDVNPQDLARIELDFEENGIQRADGGFEFRFYPMDKEGNILPVEGNLAVDLFWTELFNGERRSKTIIYSEQKYIRLSDVNPDCSPQPIKIKFENIKADGKYAFVKEDDPGFIKVTFKRSGSFDEFTQEYMPKEGERFFP